MVHNATTIDTAMIEQAVELIVGGGNVCELRALEAISAQERYPCTLAGYFDDPRQLAKTVAQIKHAKGVYITLNPVDPSLLARAHNRIRRAPKGESTADSHIKRRRWLPIDCDAKRPSGISSSESEHGAAIERCRSICQHLHGQGWPEPIIGDSGNGGHLLYAIDLPTEDEGLVQRCLLALAKRFDDDVVQLDQKVFNPARIWKLYGTLACKGDSTPDRPHRMARILSTPSEQVLR